MSRDDQCLGYPEQRRDILYGAACRPADRCAVTSRVSTRIPRIRIRGVWWTIRRERPPRRERLDGLCDYATRTIYVNPVAVDQRATLLHEVLHAALPDLTEMAVEQTEKALETALRVDRRQSDTEMRQRRTSHRRRRPMARPV